MTQEECLKILERENRWMTTKEINNIIGIRAGTENLNKMFKYGEVLRKEVKVKKGFLKTNCYMWKIAHTPKRRNKKLKGGKS